MKQHLGKKILSMLLALSMILSIMPMTTFAELTGTEKAKMIMHVFVDDASSATGYKEVTAEEVPKKEGQVFYIGIEMKDFGNIKEVNEYDETNEKWGLTDIATGVSYDSNYVTYEPNALRRNDIVSASSVTNLWTARLANFVSLLDVTTKDYDTYTMRDSMAGEAEVAAGTVDAGKGLDTKSGIAYGGSSNGDFFMAYSGARDAYLVVMQFAYTAKIETDQTPKRIISFCTDQQYSSALFGGYSGAADKKLYQYKGDGIDNGTPADILAVVEFDDSAANFLPQQYTVSFYKDQDTADTSGTAIKDINVTEGKTIAEMSKTSDIPGAADFKDYAPAGKFFEGLYYQKDGSETAFNENVKIDADTKVYAKYTDGYTIAVHPNYPTDAKIGTTEINSTNYPDLSLTVDPATDTKLTADDEPKKDKDTSTTTTVKNPDGYYFGGWYTDQACTAGNEVKFDGTMLATATNKNIFAKWTKAWTVKVVKIEGDTDSENAPLSTEEIEPNADGKTYAKPSAISTDPTREGYKFNGWYYKDNGTKTTFVFDGENNATKITGDTTIYADWTKIHTVKYFETETDATTGTNVKATDEVENDSKVDSTKVPTTADTETQYFQGWYYKANGGTETKFDPASDKVTSDLNLYQKWGDCYKIEFFKEKTDSTAYATKYLNPNKFTNPSDIKLAVADFPEKPTKDGFGFNRWVYDVSGTDTLFDENVVVSGNMKVYAEWTAKITVKLYPNDGTQSNFLGTPQEFKIVPNNDITTDTSKTYTEPTRENYKFKEWNTEPNGTGTSYTSDTVKSTKFAASTDLYAIWEVDPGKVPADQQVTLTFDAVGGTLNNPTSITVKKGDSIYPQQLPADPTKTKDGAAQAYDFLGWFEAATLTNTNKVIDKKADQTAAIQMDDSKTVYAHWDYTGTDKVTITFDSNGATTAATPSTVAIAPGDVIGKAMPTDPVLTNKAFDGWYIQTADTDKVNADTTTFNADTTVKAHWIDEITVKYNVNGGDAATIADSKGFPTATYTNPTTDPTKSGYKFMGWNTAANGSGTFITNDVHTTFEAVSKAAQGSAPSAPTEVTLYAYWAKVPTATAPGLPPDDTKPEDGGVKVMFDSNASGHKNATVTDANPKQVYVAKGDAIGTLMPNAPTSTHYKFVKWNTKPDGSGVDVDNTTLINDDLELKEIPDTNKAYEVTLYAQWDIGDDVANDDKVTVTFNKNENLKGDATNTTKVVTLFKGDALGYEPADPTNETYNFEGWYDTYNAVLSSTSPTGKLDKDASIDKNVTYYAQWVKYIKLEFATVNGVKQDNAEYTGSIIAPKWDAYETDKDGNKKAGVANVLTNAELSADFNMTAQGPNNATDIQNVGEYQVTVTTTTTGQEKGYKIVNYDQLFKVTQAKLTVKVKPSTQTGKVDTANGLAPVEIKVVNAGGTELGVGVAYDVVYNLWTNANNDNVIDTNELGQDMKNPTQADFKAVGKYVVKVVPTDNYIVDSVVSEEEGKDVLRYGETAGYATFATPPTLKGQDIVFEVQANDPSINALTIKSDGANTTLSDALDLKDDNTFANTITFDNAENPTVNEYWVRVSDVKADTGKFEFTVTNDTTKVGSVTVNGTALASEKITQNGKTVTFDADLTKTGQDLNDVVIVTKAGSDQNAPSITYTFHIQRLVEAKIELNYGNSPVGLIKNMINAGTPWGETKVNDAITYFATNNTYGTGFVPDKAVEGFTYTTAAWNGSVDPSVNMDRNEYAIFAYNKEAFNDTGFTATDSLGQAVQVKRTITVDSMNETSLDAVTTGKYTAKAVTITDADDKCALNAITETDVVPNTYKMTYSFTDTVTNTEVKVERPIVILWELGDVDMSSIINPSDVTALYSVIKSKVSFTNAPQNFEALYTYRIADADLSEIVNPSDVTALYSIIKGKVTNKVYNTK